MEDLGGFNDGLLLVASFLVGPIAAILFENNLIRESRFSPTPTHLQKKKRRRIAHLLNDPNEGDYALMAKSTKKTVIESIKDLKQVHISLFKSVLDCLLHCFKKRRSQAEINRLKDRYED